MKKLESIEELIELGKLWSEKPKLKTSSLKVLNFGLPQIDKELAHGGLVLGALHEFCSESSNVPLGLLSALSVRAMRNFCLLRSKKNTAGYTIWIGKDCWPSPLFLRNLLSQEELEQFFAYSLFIDSSDEKKRLWSIEAALSCPIVSSVIAHLHKISFPLSRRLSHAAKSTNVLGFFVIEKEFIHAPSAAATRWHITPAPSTSSYPRFKLSLLKQKGGFSPFAPLLLEFVEDGKGVSLSIPSNVVDSSHTTEIEKPLEYTYLRAAQR